MENEASINDIILFIDVNKNEKYATILAAKQTRRVVDHVR
jgi:hypothetical protein